MLLFTYACADKHLSSSSLSMLMNKVDTDCLTEVLNVNTRIHIYWIYIMICMYHKLSKGNQLTFLQTAKELSRLLVWVTTLAVRMSHSGAFLTLTVLVLHAVVFDYGFTKFCMILITVSYAYRTFESVVV